MGEILLFTINSIMPIILLILVGYLLRRKGFLTPEFLKIGNKTVFYVLLPVLLFKNIADIESLAEIRLDVVLYVFVIIAILVFGGFLVTFLIPDPKQKGVVHQCIFRSNFALIGVPLAELLGGPNGVRTAAVLSLFTIPAYNVLGVIALSVYKDGSERINPRKIIRDILHNPLIIGVLAGLAFAVIRILIIGNEILPGDTVVNLKGVTFLSTTISYLSRAATPLALIVLGGSFDLKRIGGYRRQLVIGIVGRNFVAPFIGIGAAAMLTVSGRVSFGPDVFAALIALFGTPVAVASAIMAEAMDNDGQLAGQLVVWTSLISLFSLFLFIFAARAVGVI